MVPLGLDSYAETPQGLLMIANGMGAVKIWDGLSSSLEDAGLEPPGAALTVSGATAGNIAGTYFAYERFVDARGNFSDLSPVSTAYEAAGGLSGNITDVTNSKPIIVTSAGHGLASGDRVTVSEVKGTSNANGVWTVTVLDANRFTLRGSSGDRNYREGGEWVSGVGRIDYAAVPVPSSSKVVRRQILRNTAGQAATFYIDVDSTDLVATTFSSTKDDDTLAAQTAVPLFNDDDSLNANSHGVPPPSKSALAHLLGRMFFAVDVDYAEGCVSVANGSTTVTGVGTDWPSVFDGRFLYVVGADKVYEVESIDTSAQTLTLTESYGGTTDKFAAYSIRPEPAGRRLIYFSESGLPESVPSVNAVGIADNGDELTGLMVLGPYLYVLERRHVHRITFQTNPGIDGAVFQVAVRGCVNNRCWVTVGDNAYFLDQQGIHSLTGGDEAESLSSMNQPLFIPQSEAFLWVNWLASRRFHAAHYPAEEVIRWFVCLSGDEYPRHAICLDYRGKRTWVEEYPRPVTASTTLQYEGTRRVFFGSDGSTVWLLAQGRLDGVDPAAGTASGTATAGGPRSLADGTASFAASLPGAVLCLTAGRGKGQWRRVTEVDGTTLYVDTPWEVEPDDTTEYQLGGVPWHWLSRWFKYHESERQTATKVGVGFQPANDTSYLTLRVYRDYSDEAVEWAYTQSADEGEGFASEVGSDELVANLAGQLLPGSEVERLRHGYAQQRFDRHKEYNLAGGRFWSLGLSGVQGVDPVRVFRLTVEGATERG